MKCHKCKSEATVELSEIEYSTTVFCATKKCNCEKPVSIDFDGYRGLNEIYDYLFYDKLPEPQGSMACSAPWERNELSKAAMQGICSAYGKEIMATSPPVHHAETEWAKTIAIRSQEIAVEMMIARERLKSLSEKPKPA